MMRVPRHLRNRAKPLKPNAAFSLIELIVVVAVISFLAAAAIPALSKVNTSANEAVAKRNAQYAATVSSAANADGAYHVVPQEIDPNGLILSLQNLRNGVTGEYTGIRFEAKLTDDQMVRASRYLNIELKSGIYTLVYDPSGN